MFQTSGVLYVSDKWCLVCFRQVVSCCECSTSLRSQFEYTLSQYINTCIYHDDMFSVMIVAGNIKGKWYYIILIGIRNEQCLCGILL